MSLSVSVSVRVSGVGLKHMDSASARRPAWRCLPIGATNPSFLAQQQMPHQQEGIYKRGAHRKGASTNIFYYLWQFSFKKKMFILFLVTHKYRE